MPLLHSYHLDDNPDLQSRNLQVRSLPGPRVHAHFSADRRGPLGRLLRRGRDPLVRERLRVDYGKAQENEYVVEHWEDER
jgi:hypothetical protein